MKWLPLQTQKKRPRGTVYGWKKAPIEHKGIIDEVRNKLDKEIKMLGNYKIYP
jgi:hypothetical protein